MKFILEWHAVRGPLAGTHPDGRLVFDLLHAFAALIVARDAGEDTRALVRKNMKLIERYEKG